MKRYIQITLLLAALVSMSVSCDNNNLDTSSYTFNFTSQKPVFDDEVKTVWNGSSIIWSSDDKIRVAFTVDGIWQNGSGNVETASDATLYVSTQAQSEDEYVTANFSVPTSFKGTNTSGSHKFYALYPSDKVNGNDTKFAAPNVKLNVSASQALSSDTFDPSADLMLGTSGEIDGRPTSAIPLWWNRLVAHAYITLADLKDWTEGEVVTSITLTADAEASMTGDFDLNITTGEAVLKSSNTTSNVLTLSNGSLTVVDGDVSFWACMMPCTWSELTVEVETDKATYTRVIDLSENQKIFLKNRRNLLRIKMNDAVRVEKVGNEVTYTFTNMSWADATGSWTSIKDGSAFSNNGVAVRSNSVTEGVWPSASCEVEFDKVKAVNVTYCTNKKAGKGNVSVTIGTSSKNCDIQYQTGDGATASWVAELDFSDTLPTGTPVLTVTCSENSVYIKSITIIAE